MLNLRGLRRTFRRCFRCLDDADLSSVKGVIGWEVEIVVEDDDGGGGGEKRFSAEIVSGNEQGLFSVNGLALFTAGGTARRRLDRETLDHHELVVRVRDLNWPRREPATCMISVKLSDLNDNRPIVNDIELVIYDKLDTR